MSVGLDLSQIIRSERNRLGLSQAELAQKIGVSDSYLAHIERAQRTPSAAVIISLSEQFGFTLQQQRALLDAAESSRLERASRRLRTRGRAVRGALRSREAAGTGAITLVDPVSGVELGRPLMVGGLIRFLCFSPDATRLATADEQGKTTLWDLSGPEAVRQLQFGDAPLTALTFLPDGEHVVGADEDLTVKVWDTATGSTTQIENDLGRVVAIASPPGADLLALGDENGQLALCSLPDRKTRWSTDGHVGAIESMAFSLDGGLLATAGRDALVRLWRAGSGKEERALEHDSPVSVVCFSPDGRRVAGGGTAVTVWDASNGAEIAIVRGPGSPLLQLALQGGGDVVIGVCRDGTIFTLDVRAGAIQRSVRAKRAPFLAAALSTDASRLAVSIVDSGAAFEEITPDVIAEDLASDPDLLAAYRDLRAGLENPSMRATVLTALKAFAKGA